MCTAPSTATYMGLLKACINSKSIAHAKQVASYLIGNNIPFNGLLGDYLVVTLAKCGAIDDALQISATLPCRTVFSWTAMISAYVELGCGHEALQLFKRMVEDGVEPNHFTFVSLFQACGTIPDLEQGKKLHADAHHRGLLSNLFVGNSLVSMYVKCMAIKDAEDVFSTLLQRDVVSWNTMLSAYAEQGQAEKAIRLYRQLQEDGESPDHLTLMSAIQACSILVGKEKTYCVKGCATASVALEIGQALQAEARKKSWIAEVVVGTALVILYGKCGDVALAEHVFCASSHRDTVIWNSMLAAYLEQGHGEKALHFYALMQKECVTLDEVTCIYSLQACGNLGSLEICNELHFVGVSAGCDSIHSVAATLIQTYRSCACMLDAQAFFNALSNPDYVTWTTCIAGHAGDGNSIASLHMFEHMRFSGIKPDEILFTAVLAACSHAGLVAEGLQYFKSLRFNYGVHPNLKHYGIMLDLFGRAGDFKGVDTLLKQMPVEADFTIWLSLLGACRMHSHVDLAKCAFEHVVSLQPEQTFAYILMANIYVDAGLQDCAADVEIAKHKVAANTKPIHSLLDDELYAPYS